MKLKWERKKNGKNSRKMHDKWVSVEKFLPRDIHTHNFVGFRILLLHLRKKISFSLNSFSDFSFSFLFLLFSSHRHTLTLFFLLLMKIFLLCSLLLWMRLQMIAPFFFTSTCCCAKCKEFHLSRFFPLFFRTHIRTYFLLFFPRFVN